MLSWVSYIEGSKKLRKRNMNTLKIHTQNPSTLHGWCPCGSNHHLPSVTAVVSRLLSPWLPTIKSNIATGETLLKHRLITVPTVFQGFPVTRAQSEGRCAPRLLLPSPSVYLGLLSSCSLPRLPSQLDRSHAGHSFFHWEHSCPIHPHEKLFHLLQIPVVTLLGLSRLPPLAL